MEKWQDIHATRPNPGLPATPRLVTPRVNNPQCPEHCSGRHQIDGFVQCPTHKTPMYRVVLHEYPWQDGHYWTSLAPMNGSPTVKAGENETCPDCRKKLVRSWR